ncbi:tRNA splicing endonuclease subunit sen2 [Tulasnella sp. JGI-2019a]|nr:tRNA splicing endonuclease subunit sen2 [Tulasnella sp. JGI-2019a]KAG9036335.1 tRNA splicing endonuclease subunit sen2 [Tulasnella sp. JGI-2019a]
MPPKDGPGGAATKRKRGNHNVIYGNALPILSFPDPAQASWLSALSYFKSSSKQIISNPDCVGILDVASRSVWVVNARDMTILWQRGFFGKGSLSRSEPSWLTRRLNEVKDSAKGYTAEDMTAKRRAERKQFKTDRADAIAAARTEAEAVFAATGTLPPALSELAFIPSHSRPTRPIPSATPVPEPPVPIDVIGRSDAIVSPRPFIKDTPVDILGSTSEEPMPEPIVEQMEHLQLTLQEAFFLSWSLGCLRVLNPETDTYLTVQDLLRQSLDACLPFAPPKLSRRADSPFLVNYAVYHHYRSLGWVVKGGIKFCVDYLLYKKGPVFHHAEFALVVCPVYEEPEDEETSPFDLPNSKPMDWAWFSTINRVNSQVKKASVA